MQDSINIVLLGNSTTEYLGSAICSACAEYHIAANLYNSPYNRHIQEILSPSSGLYCANPELVIILLEGKLLFPEWYDFKFLQSDGKKKEAFVQSVFDSIVHLIEKVHSHISARIIINNFKVPYFSPLGVLDSKYCPGLKNMIGTLNGKLEEWASNKDYVFVFDYNGLSAQFGYSRTSDSKMYYIAKSAMSFPFLKVLAKEYMRYILPLKCRSRKCLVLDLDNTLWGGIAGEDGIAGIELDISGAGSSFYDFQREILNLYHRGVILAVNSKNNYEDAISIIENHPHMLLRKSCFSALKINWQDKAENLRELSDELNIGIDSMVFIDDNPVEREYVKSALPQVKVVDMPEDKSKYVEVLHEIVEFEIFNITDEDVKRNEMYETNVKRLHAHKQFKSLEDYLASLETRVIVEYANEFNIPRIAQLTQKTNQFNMTTKRYASLDIESMSKSDKYLVLSCSVRDRFGDSGLVGVCIIEFEGTYIDTFLLSCRVLGRNIEYSFLAAVADIARQRGLQSLHARFIRTEKNKANESFYPNSGFSRVSCSENESLYSLRIKDTLKDFSYNKVIVNEIHEVRYKKISM